MLIAIDYDKTYTLAPGFWSFFIDQCIGCGHQIICVTGRSPTDRISELTIPVVYTDGQLKRYAAEYAGYQVDVWIDDEPGTIERCKILEWD